MSLSLQLNVVIINVLIQNVVINNIFQPLETLRTFAENPDPGPFAKPAKPMSPPIC
jgi:hypothetical protein